MSLNMLHILLVIWSLYSFCYLNSLHWKLFCNCLWTEESNVTNCVWNCRGSRGYAHSFCCPVFTATVSEWKDSGAKRFSQPRGWEIFKCTEVWGERYPLLCGYRKVSGSVWPSLKLWWGQGTLDGDCPLGLCSAVKFCAAGVCRK